MKQVSTLFLKVAIVVFGMGVLALCVFGIPWITEGLSGFVPKIVYVPIISAMYLSALPFFFALYRTINLLGCIDKNRAFSAETIGSLKHIKYCAILISILYIAAMPSIFYVGDKDDAPGLIIIGLVFVGAPMVVAVFAAVLQKLVKYAVDMKSENDLTV